MPQTNGEHRLMRGHEERTISDADVEAIAAAMERRLEQRFVTDVGKGFLGFIRKALFLGLLAIAAYGAGHSSLFTWRM